MTRRKNTPGMNMRDMKQRSMNEHRLDGISRARQRPIDEPSPHAADLDVEDPFELAIHVDQGDGTFAAQNGYDTDEEDYELPDSPPDGWWD